MTESGEEWLERILETFSQSDERGQTLFENLEDSGCALTDRLRGCRTNKTRSLYRGLAREYVDVAKIYAAAFEVLNDDPVISWFVENGTFGLDKIELLRKKGEKLSETIKTLERTLKNPIQTEDERVEHRSNLTKSRRKQLRKEARRILEEEAKTAEQRIRQKP